MLDALLSDTDAIVVPAGSALVNIADRAGYPVLTVPAGFGTGGSGRNPIGVVVHRQGGRRRRAAERRLRVRAGHERAARPELDEPEHVPLRARLDVLLTAPLPPGRRSLARPPTARPRRPSRVTSAAPSRRRSRSRSAADGDVRRVHAGHREGLHRDHAGERHLDRGRRGADRRSVPGVPDQRHVLAAVAAGGLLLQGDWTAPVSNDPVTITFKQHIGAERRAAHGRYSKTLTFTLSTTTP